MTYATEHLAGILKTARERQGISQRRLGELVGMPQAHISKIENGTVDLRVSSLVALARGLGLELVLVPRRALPAVRSLARGLGDADETESRPAYRLDVEDDRG